MIMNVSQKDRPLSIGFLRRGYSSTGGAEAYLSRLVEGLQAKGYRVLLLGTGDWPQEKWPGGETVVLPNKSLTTFGEAALSFQQEKKLDLLFSMERVPGVTIFRAGDGVHADWLEIHYAKLSRWRKFFSLFRHREVLALEKKLFAPTSKTHVIANSAMVANQITKRFSFPSSQITIIPNGVPTVAFPTEAERKDAREKIGIAADAFVALFVGSGWERKGLRVAIEAVGKANQQLQNQSTKLLVAGKGSIKKYAKDVLQEVLFLGPVHELSSLYAAADVFILPTLYDPFSNASLEALAAGLPVITSAMNGCSEILTEGVHGSTIKDPNDSDAFAAALIEWRDRFQDKDAAIQIHHCCSERGAEFSIERNVQATIEVFKKTEKA